MVLDQVSPDGCTILICRIQLQDSPGMKSSASVYLKAHVSGDVLLCSDLRHFTNESVVDRITPCLFSVAVRQVQLQDPFLVSLPHLLVRHCLSSWLKFVNVFYKITCLPSLPIMPQTDPLLAFLHNFLLISYIFH